MVRLWLGQVRFWLSKVKPKVGMKSLSEFSNLKKETIKNCPAVAENRFTMTYWREKGQKKITE